MVPSLADELPLEWARCLQRNRAALERWQADDSGKWQWTEDGVRVEPAGAEWCEHLWHFASGSELRRSGHFEVELSVEGAAGEAGISFGPDREFLAVLPAQGGKRHIRLEVDAGAGTWTFQLDGLPAHRSQRDAAIQNAGDILGGRFRLKARSAQCVRFSGFSARKLQAVCRASVLITCYRFQQRLRLALKHWCHQTPGQGSFEVLVVNPQSPDGTHELLLSFARAFTHVRIREVSVPATLACNKGAMINRAFRVSSGEWIWLTDADCLFPPNCLPPVLDHIGNRKNTLFYGERRYLTQGQADSLLAGRQDSLAEFRSLSEAACWKPPEISPWGYTQIIHRSVLERIPYREYAQSYAQTDNVFARECEHAGMGIEPVPGLLCLHLHHPFSWQGTNEFL